MTEKTPSKAPKETSGKVLKSGWRTFAIILLMLVWAAAAIIAAQLVVGYIMIGILGTDRFNQPVWTAVFSALAYVVAMILIIFVPRKIIALRRHEKSKSERDLLGLRGLPTWTDIGLAPVGFVVYLILAAGLTALFSLFPWFNPEQVQEVGFDTMIVGVDRILAFVTLVVVAPIAEEVIFRGWLYGKIRTRLNEKMSNWLSMVIAIFLVSLLFGIVHMQWNVGVNVFAMSIVLCGLREITGTIYSGIILHMLKNGVAFYLLYVLGIG